jgi:hypothetical protein
MKKIIFIFLFLSLFLTDKGTRAQNGQIVLVSEVQEGLTFTKKEKRRKPFTVPTELSNVEVNITENGHIMDRYILEDESRLDLNPDINYTVKFNKKGYIPKLISINTHGMSTDFIMKGYELFVDISLFKILEHVNTSAYAKLPGAKCFFDSNMKSLTWDMGYSQDAFETFISMNEQNKKRLSNQKKRNNTESRMND